MSTISRKKKMVQPKKVDSDFLTWAKSYIEAHPHEWPLLNGHDDEEKWARLAWNAAHAEYHDPQLVADAMRYRALTDPKVTTALNASIDDRGAFIVACQAAQELIGCGYKKATADKVLDHLRKHLDGLLKKG